MHKSFWTLLCIVALILPNHLYGKMDDEQYVMVKDLKKSLLIYDSKQKGYVPHAYDTPLNNNAVSFILDPIENGSLYVKICAQANSALFVTQKIVATQDFPGCFILNIDSLRKEYGEEGIFVTLYNKELNLKQTEIQLVKSVALQEAIEKPAEVVEVVPRKTYPFKNFFVIGLMAILGLFAMVKRTYPKAFNEFYSISRILSLRWREDSIVASRPVSSANLLFLMLYSLVLAFIIQTLWHETGGVPSGLNLVSFESFTASFSSWMIVSMLVFVVMIIKYIIIWFTSTLLGFKDLVSFHFLDYIRISQLFLLFLLVFITLSTLSYNNLMLLNENLFVYIIGLCVLITIILLFFKLLTASTYRNVHLFSYLCTTEILPLIIGIKFFLNL